jgi:hypothetical protein
VYTVQFAQNRSKTHNNRPNNPTHQTYRDRENIVKKSGPYNTCNQDSFQTTARPKFVHKLNSKISIQCSICKLMGHLASNRVKLPLKPEKMLSAKKEKALLAIKVFTAADKPVDLLQITSSVNGIPADLYFDSGATASLISARLIKTHKIPSTR